jgi:hypothetical protein
MSKPVKLSTLRTFRAATQPDSPGANATLELLDEIPNHETFEQVDAVFSGLSTLRPARLQKLLADCASVKVKRLFFFFADRHKHAWLKRLDKDEVDLGSGKRMLTRGASSITPIR